MEFTPLSLVYDVCIISALIVVAKVIRARVSFFSEFLYSNGAYSGFSRGNFRKIWSKCASS